MTALGSIIIRNCRGLRYATERDLQQGLARLFETAGFAADREVALGPAERPDFMIDGIAIEVKVKGTRDQLERQITRYAGHDHVAGVLVVTNRVRHRDLPPLINGKPVHVVCLATAF